MTFKLYSYCSRYHHLYCKKTDTSLWRVRRNKDLLLLLLLLLLTHSLTLSLTHSLTRSLIRVLVWFFFFFTLRPNLQLMLILHLLTSDLNIFNRHSPFICHCTPLISMTMKLNKIQDVHRHSTAFSFSFILLYPAFSLEFAVFTKTSLLV